ncbi:hypothetical protein C8J56DRAFT_1162985 [Mycena floridula]|nr:hypothetical protein C8J56DRAFT_1162985 [Mycena floridula]
MRLQPTKHRAPSTTSLSSDNEDDDNVVSDRNAFSSVPVVSPAQWTKRLPSAPSRQPPKLSYISHLPPELLIHILKHLHSTRDLHSCLRVSRTWCECSVELLWHKPAFAKFETLDKMTRRLTATDQTFTYASFVRRLNLCALSRDIKDDTFSILSKCDRLERLTLINCDAFTGPTLAQVLPKFSNLVALDLSGVTNTTDQGIVGVATVAKRLQGINLMGCKKVSDVGIMALANNCPLMRRVKLSGLVLLTNDPISALAHSCPLLLELDLNYCELITDVAVREIWTHSVQMREMRLSHCPELTDAAFPAPVRKEQTSPSETPNPFPSSANVADELPPLKITRPFEHLRMLDLTACSLITDDAVEGIIAHAPRIRNLVFSKCYLLTDRSVENICRLGRYLHYLHLGHASKITDRSVRILARSCTRLRYIDFANCVLLTDMSVFELSSLPKLRRVGLVRVSNLTDEAIYSLAERHATLERIHLSYCDQISVMAIHFLLQKLHKLTHLSLTGVPAFRQPELQQFCRDPPTEFSSTQQLAFCVYSGKGVSQLRAFLTELFDHITEMNGTDDTEYEDDDCDEFNEDDAPDADASYGDDEEVYLGRRTRFLENPAIDHRAHRASAPSPEPQRSATFPPSGSSSSMYDFAPAVPGSRVNQTLALPIRRARAPPAPSMRSLADMIPIIENSHSPPPSDVASNRSAGTNRSNGATFYRTYNQDGVPSRSSGILTPDLNYAEIGHGRGALASLSTQHLALRRGQDQIPQFRPAFLEIDAPRVPSPEPSTSKLPSTSLASSSSAHHQNIPSAETGFVAWPYREPASPTTSGSPSAKETQEMHESRGRSVRRSIRDTLASTFLFGRSPTRGQDDNGEGSSRRAR